MFQLSLVDHLRLSFGSAVAAYQGHTAAAKRLTVVGWYARAAALGLAGLAAAASLLALRQGHVLQIAAAVLILAAFAAFAVCAAFDPMPRIHGHRACAARLWLICERYRSLLTEVQDGLLDVDAVIARRDALLAETGAILEQASPADRETFAIAQQALSGPHQGGYPDAALNQFLPPALHRTEAAANPATPAP